MKFLLEDPNPKHNKLKFIDLFDQEVPTPKKDVVVMFITVIGMIDGKLQERTFQKKIYGDKTLNAIQRTTAPCVCGCTSPHRRQTRRFRFRNRKMFLLKYLQAINLGNYMNRNDYDSIIEKAISIQKEWRTVPIKRGEVIRVLGNHPRQDIEKIGTYHYERRKKDTRRSNW